MGTSVRRTHLVVRPREREDVRDDRRVRRGVSNAAPTLRSLERDR
jgi:hypothetical protein